MDSKQITSLIITAVVVGAGGFYGGMRYQATKAPSLGNGSAFMAQRGAGGGLGLANGAPRGGQIRGGLGGGLTAGEILSKDDSSITLKLQDGGSKIILFTTSTRVGKFSEGSLAELAPGTAVSVTGAANSDGSVSATMFQIRPVGEMPPGMGGRPDGGAPPSTR
ncbi:hypothetical protein KBA73_02855 [Patescibacteria group bacterium]|nr:hypothetical protein [Patescibacteria group bacterium]